MSSSSSFITKISLQNRAAMLSLFTLAVLLLPNIGLSITEPMTLLARIANILLPGGVYMLLLTILRNPARSVWLTFLLIFLSAFQVVLLFLFGDSIIAVDMFLNLVTTNASEVGELLGSLIPAMTTVIVVYVPLLVVAAIRTRRKDYTLSAVFIKRMRRAGVIVTVAGALTTGACYACVRGYRVQDQLYPVNVFYNIGLAVERSRLTADYEKTSADFTFSARPTHDAGQREVYVLVIGETARAENFGLFGYDRDTTPLLSKAKGVIGYSQAFTQSNTTHKSVPMIMSGVSAENFNDIYNQKSVITAFKEAGFKTAFISNQRPNHSFIDLFGEEADYCRFIKTELSADSNPYDGELVEIADSLIRATEGSLFIVLHTYGSHFRYSERYPEDYAKFLPDGSDEALASNRPTLVNAYDNTIRYTDSVLGAMINSLEADSITAAMLYASDHGENIFDTDEELFLHASPRPSAYELHVPMIAWLSEKYRENYPAESMAMEKNSGHRIITSAMLFHTALALAGIETPFRDNRLSVASDKLADRPYLYLSDRNIAVPVEEIKRK